MKRKSDVILLAVVGVSLAVRAAQPLSPEMQREFEKRGIEAGETVRVEIPGGFDVGQTVEPSTNKYLKVGQGRTEKSCVHVLPPCVYTGAKVRFSVDPDKKKDRAFTLRLTRYVDNPADPWVGRAYDAMCNVLVETDKVAKREVGTVNVDGKDVPLYETDVAIDMGDILGILRDDCRGTFSARPVPSSRHALASEPIPRTDSRRMRSSSRRRTRRPSGSRSSARSRTRTSSVRPAPSCHSVRRGSVRCAKSWTRNAADVSSSS